jgi:hypothetical protein
MRLSRRTGGWVVLGWVIMTLIVLACTCGPLTQAQEVQGTAVAALGSAEAQLTALGPTLDAAMTLMPTVMAQATVFAPTLNAMATQMPDLSGLPPQFATSAVASSEYSSPSWSAMQATGAPDTFACGDTETAWASLSAGTVEWLELHYDQAVTPAGVAIYQTHNPGYVVRVEAVDMQGATHTLYEGQPNPAAPCPYPQTITVSQAGYQTQALVITVDQTSLGNWTEIDAVALFGTP